MQQQVYVVTINGWAIEITTELARATAIADRAILAYPGQVSTSTLVLP